MRRPSARPFGYSLVELLLILAVMGILALVGVSFLQDKTEPAVRGTLEALVATLGEGRQLARSTGQRVTLRVKGSESQDLALALEFVDPATHTVTTGGVFQAQALDAQFRNRAAVGVGAGQLASVAPDLGPLKQIPIVPDWDEFLLEANALFPGAESGAFSFDPSGQVSGGFFVTVSAAQAGPGSPLGLVVVTRDNGVHAYFKGAGDAPWKSL